MLGRLALEGIRLGALREELVDDGAEIGEDELPEGSRVGVAVADGDSAAANPLLQVGELPPALPSAALGLRGTMGCDLLRRGQLAQFVLLVCGNRIDVDGIAQVEEGVARHVGVPEHPLHDLQLGDGPAGILPEPPMSLDQVGANLVRNPSVALTKQADEVRAAALDLGQAVDRTSPLSSSGMPHRRSTSPQVTPRSAQRLRSFGKTCLTSSSRSSCMSRNVDETNTRIVLVFAGRATDAIGSAIDAGLPDHPGAIHLKRRRTARSAPAAPSN